MKVFIVFGDVSYGGSEVLGVFSSYSLSEEFTVDYIRRANNCRDKRGRSADTEYVSSYDEYRTEEYTVQEGAK